MSKVLNGHLKRSEKDTLACEHWTSVKLQEFMGNIAAERSEDLQKIYQGSKDRRVMHGDTLEEHRMQWAKLNHIVGNHPHLAEPQQEAHCREAVMWWTHHLSEETRQSFRAKGVTVPLLPESPKKACGRG